MHVWKILVYNLYKVFMCIYVHTYLLTTYIHTYIHTQGLVRVMKAKKQMFETGKGLDWATAGMHVCMYVFMRVCMYSCMYVFMCVCMYVYMYVCMY